MPFRPGPGVGGHCSPIDPSYLPWRVTQSLGLTFRFVELANEVNEHMPDYVVRRLVSALNDQERSMKGSRILVAGVAYKRTTGDDRESPSGRVIELLTEQHADVVVRDPHVDPERSHVLPPGPPGWSSPPTRCARPTSCSSSSTTTPSTCSSRGRGEYVLDTRRCTSGTNVEHLLEPDRRHASR
ncbi:UDP binding domain-containing protein [Aquihabitans sp. G128]|uniref:UDP binding domain-containing protein n=1 Tax=Aquihabitans sp. G128 TaxID=2849779 RepID=UPI00352D0FA6